MTRLCVCGNCAFFERYDDHCGECVRYPPQRVWEVFSDSNGHIDGEYNDVRPTVGVNDWCGEHRTPVAE